MTIKCLWVMLASCLAGVVVLFLRNGLPLADYRQPGQRSLPYVEGIDSQRYLAMAEGRMAGVESPFSKRFLYPCLIRILARNTQISVGTAAMSLNFAAWILLSFCLAWALQKLGGNPWLVLLFLLTPVPLESLLLGYMPDLFHTALVALFFLLLMLERDAWALPVLLLAFLTRESTLILCLIACGLGFRRHRKTLAYGSLAVLIAGLAAGSWFIRQGQPNIHHLPDFLYMALKLPFNFLRNMLGIVVQTNVRGIGDPVIRLVLPHILQFGADKEIGLAFDWTGPAEAYLGLLTVFGFAPLLAWRWRRRAGLLHHWPVAVQIAFLYGFVCFVMGTSLGAWVARILSYAWPLFWLVGPCFLKPPGWEIRPGETAFLAACYLLVSWMPTLCGFGELPRQYSFLLLFIPLLYAVTHRCVVRIEARSAMSRSI